MPPVVPQQGRVIVTSVLLFFTSLFLAAYSARNPWLAYTGTALVEETLRPLQLLLKGTSHYFGGIWEGYIDLVGIREENQKLHDRLHALEVENSRLLEWEDEIRRLRSLLSIADQEGIKGVAAEVIGYDPSNWSQAVSINRGSQDGLHSGQAVIQGNYVVGQITSVSANTARVLLITDHSSGVDAIVQSSRARGVVEGAGSDMCTLRYVNSEDEVAIGDRVITSGMDGIFPKGLVIGIVSEVRKKGSGMFHEIKVKPSAHFSKLETLLVITAP